MFSFKTKIKILKTKISYILSKNRYMGNHPKSKKFITVIYLLFIDSFILFNISLQIPDIEIRLKNNFTVENKVQAQVKENKTTIEPKVDLLDSIFLKESSRGKNNYSKCEAIGKFNRYGFGIPGDGSYLCFEKDEDTVAVAGWIAHHKALGYTDNQLLCLYNTGDATDTCGYLK